MVGNHQFPSIQNWLFFRVPGRGYIIYIYIYIWASYSDQLTAEVGHPKIVVSLVRKSNQNARNIQVMFFCELCGSLDPWDWFIYLHLP